MLIMVLIAAGHACTSAGRKDGHSLGDMDDNHIWKWVLGLSIPATLVFAIVVACVGCGKCSGMICCLFCRPSRDVFNRSGAKADGNREGYSNIA
jgi:hypothetical protein